MRIEHLNSNAFCPPYWNLHRIYINYKELIRNFINGGLRFNEFA